VTVAAIHVNRSVPTRTKYRKLAELPDGGWSALMIRQCRVPCCCCRSRGLITLKDPGNIRPPPRRDCQPEKLQLKGWRRRRCRDTDAAGSGADQYQLRAAGRAEADTRRAVHRGQALAVRQHLVSRADNRQSRH
jgi:hypothetical protein